MDRQVLLTLGIREDNLPLGKESLYIEPTWAIWAFSVYGPLIYCNTFNNKNKIDNAGISHFPSCRN